MEEGRGSSELASLCMPSLHLLPPQNHAEALSPGCSVFAVPARLAHHPLLQACRGSRAHRITRLQFSACTAHGRTQQRFNCNRLYGPDGDSSECPSRTRRPFRRTWCLAAAPWGTLTPALNFMLLLKVFVNGLFRLRGAWSALVGHFSH